MSKWQPTIGGRATVLGRYVQPTPNLRLKLIPPTRSFWKHRLKLPEPSPSFSAVCSCAAGLLVSSRDRRRAT